MYELQPDSDGDIRSETLNSSKSSVSCDSCSSASRLSFDAVLELPPPSKESAASSSSPETTSFFKPHRSSDSAWEAIRSAVFRRKNGLNFRDFKLIRRIGSGDIGNVYLCCLRNASISGDDDTYLYAMKVVDKEALAMKKKITRAETEKRILKMLDHPFLPTLYADFEALNFSCVVMEFCSGGDLHSLRHKQPGKRFSLSSARFYAAEVLVALEYLHMLGIVYRDLKPENILVRSDGHIMLSDFDLSLCSNSIPSVHSPDSSPQRTAPRKPSSFSCLCKRFFRSRRIRSTGSSPNRNQHHEFVAEPVSARSCSFVGTHEYVSPEVASGNSHGNAVDWWALGIFIYELIYGRTPFSGDTNEATLRNILKKPLAFPKEYSSNAGCNLEIYGRDLISGLLVKDPETRLGSKRGAADVKTHPFFKGLNFALIRSCPPPGLPGGGRLLRRSRTTSSSSSAGSSGYRRDEKKSTLTAFDYF